MVAVDAGERLVPVDHESETHALIAAPIAEVGERHASRSHMRPGELR